MENKLQPSQPGALQAQTPNTTFNLPGNNNTLVAHTDAVNNTYSVMMVGGAPPMPGSPRGIKGSWDTSLFFINTQPLIWNRTWRNNMSAEYENMQVEKWVNLEDVAEHLSLSQDTVRTWIKEGKLPVYKAGKRYKFKISEVDEWVREGKIKE